MPVEEEAAAGGARRDMRWSEMDALGKGPIDDSRLLLLCDAREELDSVMTEQTRER